MVIETMPELTVMKPALDWAVHRQVASPLDSVIVRSTGPPSDDAGTVIGDTSKAHGAPCEIVTIRPATVAVPVRAAVLWAATASTVTPLSVPLAPLWTVMKASLLMAVHAQFVTIGTMNGLSGAG
jgi:hypothetical protein